MQKGPRLPGSCLALSKQAILNTDFQVRAESAVKQTACGRVGAQNTEEGQRSGKQAKQVRPIISFQGRLSVGRTIGGSPRILSLSGICMHTNLYMCTHVSVCIEAKGQCWVASTPVVHFIFSRLGISLNLEFTQHIPRICLPPLSQCPC